MSFKFFVGTKLDDLMEAAAIDGDRAIAIAMLDGTVPGWAAGVCDFHADHHRPGGSKIQIDEMPIVEPVDNWLIATTQLDADACVAAAYFIAGHKFSECAIEKLRAIAYDCDHLCVPLELDYLADFAAKAVATFKVPAIRDQIPIGLGLDPAKSREWTDEQKLAVSAESFKRSTEWLIDAALGLRPFPGELGEADEYQFKLQSDAQMLIDENRVGVLTIPNCSIPVGDGTGKEYIDPRSFLLAWEQSYGLKEPQWTLTYRDHKSGRGIVYTLASRAVDLTQGVFDRLTAAERAIDPNADGWGGREGVGGSGWNTPSRLDLQGVIDAIFGDVR